MCDNKRTGFGDRVHLAASLQHRTTTRQPRIPPPDPEIDRLAKPAARLRCSAPGGRLDGQIVSAPTLNLDQSRREQVTG